MKNFSFTIFMMRVLFSVVGIGFGLFPTGLYFLARYAFSPEGFWQNLLRDRLLAQPSEQSPHWCGAPCLRCIAQLSAHGIVAL